MRIKTFLNLFDRQVDVTSLVRKSLKVSDPDVARVQDGPVLQGRALGTTSVQVSYEVCVCVCARMYACLVLAVAKSLRFERGCASCRCCPL